MADYVSALNGQQMDAALMDMALHNSEAWAVGTRNGYEVESDDITWENNAKYYASVAGESSTTATTAASSASESASTASSAATAASSDATRAEDAADRAEAIVGGQFVSYGQTQGLSDAQQEQARANISAGASNRNLLDNSWFRIDQRSVSGTITSGYIADRWTIAYGSGGVQASRTADSITVKSTSGSSHGDIAQRMEKSLFDFLVGKTVTASVMRSDGSVISKSFTFQSAANSIDVGTDLDGNAISVRVYQASTYQDVQFWKWKTAGTFRAVKLELGSYSTLANDVPPDYGEELRKCKYYFERVKTAGNTLSLGIGYNEGYNTMYGVMKIEPKRVTPSLSGSSLLIGTTSLNTTSSSKSIYSFGSDGTAVIQIVATNAFSTNQPYRFGLPANGYIDFTADL